MPLYTVTNGNTIFAADLNQVINVLQQPSGGSEAGYYKIEGNTYSSSSTITSRQSFLSRGVTPVSVSVGANNTGPSNLGGVSVNTIKPGMCSFQATATAIATDSYVGGQYTTNY